MGRHFRTVPDAPPYPEVWEERLSSLLMVMERRGLNVTDDERHARTLVAMAVRLLASQRLTQGRHDERSTERPGSTGATGTRGGGGTHG